MSKPSVPTARQGGTRAVASLLPGLTRTALRRGGFAEGAAVIAAWRDIAGPELAGLSRPERLVFPKGRKNGGVLHIRAAGAVATDFQHLEPVIRARVNAYLGYEAVSGIRIFQGQVADTPTAVPPPAAGREPPSAGSLPPDLSDITDTRLRAALERLAGWVGGGG